MITSALYLLQAFFTRREYPSSAILKNKMFKDGFGKYRLVYTHLWQTYGQSWNIRISYFFRLATRVLRLVVLPIITSRIIANIAEQQYDQARTVVIYFVVASLMIAMFTPLSDYLAIRSENPIYEKIVSDYFLRLVQTDIQYFNDNLAGYLTVAARQYGDSGLALIRDIRTRYINTALSILLPAIVIIGVDRIAGIVIVLLVFMQAGYLLWASNIITPYRVKSREYYKATSGVMSDTISNIVAVKSSSQEVERSKMIKGLLSKETRIFIQRYVAQSRLIIPRELMTSAFFGLVFWVTIQRMGSGAVDIAGAVLVMTYLGTILTALYGLSGNIDEHDDNVDKMLPAFEIMYRKNVIADPEKPKEFLDAKGDIVLQDVGFSYKEENSETVVFEHLNITIPAGQKIGVVGLSGAGKSTLAKLLLRFDDVQSGSVEIDGINISDVKQSDLRRQTAYVPQEPLLFHSTIRENIALSKSEATDAEIESAAKAAHAYNFIQELPQKFDSVVGERGVKLSGGQKQRIAIARAVLQNSPIIILDEATSALDSESEEIIKDSFKEILKGRTAIVVAHRLSTLSDMDRIIVIDQGKVVEDGTHEQLKKAGNLYAKLWKRQQMHLEEPLVQD